MVKRRSIAVNLTGLLLLAVTSCAQAAPVVFWHSDPVSPGETVLLVGDDLDGSTVQVRRMDDTDPYSEVVELGWRDAGPVAPVLQPCGQSLKFVIPRTLEPGVYAYRVHNERGACDGRINAPAAWWLQGDGGTFATPGGWLRVFGKNLGWPDSDTDYATSVWLQGPREVHLQAVADCYAARAELPADLPVGDYHVVLHSGLGGREAWSNSLRITVRMPAQWPRTVYNVLQFGADGTGTRDDTGAIQAALDRARLAGGGIVYLPRGRYHVTGTLEVPRLTVLRGESEELVALFWPDADTPPDALIRGTNSFSVENLTLYATRHVHGIVSDQAQPNAGNVSLYRVRMRLDAYRGHLTADEVNARFVATQRHMGGDCIRLGGRDIRVTDCDLYGSGRALYLSKTRGGLIAGNRFHNGRSGWYCISGSDGLVFEDNQIIGADLMATGGGLNCLDGSSYSQCVYYARNRLSLMHGWDREAMTSDAGGGLYIGAVASVEGERVTLPLSPEVGKRDWSGAGFYIHDGKGAGQYRRIVSIEGPAVTLDAPFDAEPDADSLVSITMLQRHYLVVGNQFSDCGIATQFYGISIEHIVAGNTCARGGGFQAIGKPYGGYDKPPLENPCQQPSWFCQFLGNTISEGNIYRSGANNSILSAGSVIGIYGWPLTKDWKWPYNVGGIVRGNRLQNNARVHVGGSGNALPSVRDVIVEGNSIAATDVGVQVDRATDRVLVRGNRFSDVAQPLSGDGAAKIALDPQQQADADLAAVRAAVRSAGVPEDPDNWPPVAWALRHFRELSEDAAPEAVRDASQEVIAAALAELGRRRGEVPLYSVAPLIGLRLGVDPQCTLARLLQSGAGGDGALGLQLAVTAAQPQWKAAVQLNVPQEWGPAVRTEAQALTPGQTIEIAVPVRVPTGSWGAHQLPAVVSLQLPDAALSLMTAVQAGSGVLRDWMVVGPFANKTGQPLDLTLHPPDDGIDLGAEYDGLAGKVRWQPVRGNDWLDLNKLFGTKEPGVAYAVACISSDREAEALLRLGSSGGVALTLNGRWIWSSGASRKPAAGQDTVAVELLQGDNVLLAKVCSNTDTWRLTAELAPVGVRFAAKLQAIAPEQFADRQSFAPPPAPVAAPAGEVSHPGGVDWQLIYADDFAGTELGARWRPVLGTWECAEGMVRASGDKAFMAYAEPLAAPLRIEYETRAAQQTVGDLSAFWLADPASYTSGYLWGFGSNGNTANKLLIDGSEVTKTDRPLPEPGKWHHVIAQVLPGGRAQLIVDDQLAVDYSGPEPQGQRFAGLWCWGAEGLFRRVRVFGVN